MKYAGDGAGHLRDSFPPMKKGNFLCVAHQYLIGSFETLGGAVKDAEGVST
jgi:hypothetical protein